MKRCLKMVLPIALAAGCLSTGPTEVGLGEEFELAPNQTVRVVGTALTIGFRRVVGDNRCPVDALCALAGQAGVDIDIFGSNADNPVRLNTEPGQDVWSDETYELRLIEVLPAPIAEHPIQPDEYRLRLIVTLLPIP